MAASFMITFHGETHDPHGMPDPFFAYVVYVSDVSSAGFEGAIATAVSITENDHAKHQHFPVSKGSIGAATEKAKAALRARHEDLTEVPSALS